MRSLPVIALVLTCATPMIVAAESPLDAEQRRCARVLPRLAAADKPDGKQRDVARAEEPLLVRAVEHRIDGCAVLIMHQTGQIRRIPEIDERRSLFMPAR